MRIGLLLDGSKGRRGDKESLDMVLRYDECATRDDLASLVHCNVLELNIFALFSLHYSHRSGFRFCCLKVRLCDP